jgi:hypothetical protein
MSETVHPAEIPSLIVLFVPPSAFDGLSSAQKKSTLTLMPTVQFRILSVTSRLFEPL